MLVAVIWETEFIQFLAVLAILHQNDLRNRMKSSNLSQLPHTVSLPETEDQNPYCAQGYWHIAGCKFKSWQGKTQPGLVICSLVFQANRSWLLFVMSDGSNLLMFALFKKSNRSKLRLSLFKKSIGAKSCRSYKLLGMNMGKVVKNCKKHGENKDFFQQITCFLRVICWLYIPLICILFVF